MQTVIRLQQPNGFNFRSEVFAVEGKLVLWVAESDENIYSLTISKVLNVDLYTPVYDGDEEEETMVIILYMDEENKIQTVEIGNFNTQDAQRYLLWLNGFANAININKS